MKLSENRMLLHLSLAFVLSACAAGPAQAQSTRLYVANSEGDDITVIDLGTIKQVDQIKLGARVHGLAAQAEGLRKALEEKEEALSEREAGVVSMRFGLTDGQPKTLDEIGKALGLTRERIRQLEKQSLSKLRHPSRAQPLLEYAV